MALEYDPNLPPKRVKQGTAKAVEPKTFRRELEPPRSRAAATITFNAQKTVLSTDQLKQCGYAYINNGIVRGVVDRSVFFIQGERTRAIVEANDELIETSTEEDVKDIEQQIADDTLTIGGEETTESGEVIAGTGQPARINDLKRKMVRTNKRVKLHSGTEKGITSALVYGRGFLEIKRLGRSPEWSRYGEPYALIHIEEENVIDCVFNDNTKIFTGINVVSENPAQPTRFIPATNLIPLFHDDNNILKNTRGSGLSAVWPILSVSQADDVINDEDIPEITKNTGGVLTIVDAETNDDNKLGEIKDGLDGKTVEVVGGGLIKGVHSVPLGRDPHELTDVRTANGKYICQCMNLPLFLLYEDTSNFATANQTMQVYKAGVLKRYRTWLQGILEDYWYDTILADHLNIDIKDVIAQPIKIKAIFPDINFETRKEIIEGDKILFDMKVLTPMDIAKDIDRKDLVPRLEQEEEERKQKEEKAKQDALANLEMARQQQQQQQQQQQNQNTANNMLQMQQAMRAQAQQAASSAASASAAASVKEDRELEIINARLGAIRSIQSVAEKINADL